MPRFEVDYYNDREQTRTKIVECDTEGDISYHLAKADPELAKIKRVKVVAEKQPRPVNG